MKKQNGKKLALVRETLVPLTPDALDSVAGGVIPTPPPTTITVTRLVCPSLLRLCAAK